ncbi:hypothetical protein HanPSC8_Chr17g0764091 [Helianthus annuus]|nr:hypothetical protein HanPSC8_Chr17g0764091 [Helianthus annuus]
MAILVSRGFISSQFSQVAETHSRWFHGGVEAFMVVFTAAFTYFTVVAVGTVFTVAYSVF